MNDERVAHWLFAIASALDTLAASLLDPHCGAGMASVESSPSTKRALAGRKGGLASAQRRARDEHGRWLSTGELDQANEPSNQPSNQPSQPSKIALLGSSTTNPDGLVGGGGGGNQPSNQATNQPSEPSQASQPLFGGILRTHDAERERERLVTALPAQYAHVANPERFYQLAEQAFRGDGERYELAVIEFQRLRDLELPK